MRGKTSPRGPLGRVLTLSTPLALLAISCGHKAINSPGTPRSDAGTSDGSTDSAISTLDVHPDMSPPLDAGQEVQGDLPTDRPLPQKDGGSSPDLSGDSNSSPCPVNCGQLPNIITSFQTDGFVARTAPGTVSASA